MPDNLTSPTRKDKTWIQYFFLGIILVSIPFFVQYYKKHALIFAAIGVGTFVVIFFFRPFFIILFLLLIRSSLDITKEIFSIDISETFQITAAVGISLIVIVCGIFYILAHRVDVWKVPVAKYFLIFLAVCFFSLFVSVDVFSGLMECLRFLSTFILYVLIWSLVDDEKKLRLFVKILIFSSLVPIAVGLFQIVFGSGQYITGYIRIFGTFTHPNPFAFYLVIVLALILNLYFVVSRKKTKFALLVLAGLGLVCLAFTFTRTAWFGLFIVLFFMAFFRQIIILWPIMGVIILAVILSPLRARFQDLTTGENSWLHRLEIWKRGLEQLPAIPIIGLGIGSFIIMDPFGEIAHNDYVRLLFELGIIGLTAYLFLFFATGYRLYSCMLSKTNPYLRAVICAAFASFMVFHMASISGNILFRPAIQWYLWGLVAVAIKGREILKASQTTETPNQ